MDTDYLMGKLEIRYTNGEADTEMIKAGEGRSGGKWVSRGGLGRCQ